MKTIIFYSKRQMGQYIIHSQSEEQDKILEALKLEEKGYLDECDFEKLRYNNIKYIFITQEYIEQYKKSH